MAKRKTPEKQDPREQAHEQLLARIPFVGTRGDGKGRTWWALPDKGGYAGGCVTGEYAAYALMKYLRETPFGASGTLQRIALDMLADRRRSSASLRGQAVGFFSIVDAYLREYAKCAHSLDKVSFEQLAERMRAGLDWTAADDRRLMREARSQAAKRGAARRKAKQNAAHASP